MLHQLLMTNYTTNCTNFIYKSILYQINYLKLCTLQKEENTRPNSILNLFTKTSY